MDWRAEHRLRNDNVWNETVKEVVLKKLIIVGIVLFSLILAVACAPTYQIILKNGETLEAKTEPVLDKESGYYDYRDKDGKKVRLKEEDVVIIKEE